MMNVFPHPPASAVTRILGEAGLPCSDLTAARLEHFFGCGSIGAPDGIVGLELYESSVAGGQFEVSRSRLRYCACGTG